MSVPGEALVSEEAFVPVEDSVPSETNASSGMNASIRTDTDVAPDTFQHSRVDPLPNVYMTRCFEEGMTHLLFYRNQYTKT